MPRIAGTAQALRIPTARDGQPYALAGELHWSEWLDTPVRQFNTIWNIPISAFGVEIQFSEGVKVPVCKNLQVQEYWLVTFDADYLKERFFREWVQPLCWSQSTVKHFFALNEQWIKDRIKYFHFLELKEQAEQLASVDRKKRSVEYWLEQLQDMEREEEAPKVEQPTLQQEEHQMKGVLEKLANEYFLLTDTHVRYKVKSEQLTPLLSKDTPMSYLLDNSFYFTVDLEKEAPKSRNAKGWVKTLALVEG